MERDYIQFYVYTLIPVPKSELIDIFPLVLTNIIQQYAYQKEDGFLINFDLIHYNDEPNATIHADFIVDERYVGFEFRICLRVRPNYLGFDKYISMLIMSDNYCSLSTEEQQYIKRVFKKLIPLNNKYFLEHKRPDGWTNYYSTKLIEYKHRTNTPQTNILRLTIMIYNLVFSTVNKTSHNKN